MVVLLASNRSAFTYMDVLRVLQDAIKNEVDASRYNVHRLMKASASDPALGVEVQRTRDAPEETGPDARRPPHSRDHHR